VERFSLANAKCRALVISCSDFRFVSALRQARLDLGLENAYDLLARPGGVRQLVKPLSEAGRETIYEEIALLHRLHGFDRILLMNHMTCGAYADVWESGNEDEFHKAHLLQAKEILKQRYPGLTIEPYLSVIIDDAAVVTAVDEEAQQALEDAQR
jgi:carbonic anhydrase